MRKMFSKKQIETTAKAVADLEIATFKTELDAIIFQESGENLTDLETFVSSFENVREDLFDNGAAKGQVLTTDGHGGSEWTDPNYLTIEEVEFTEDDWDSEEGKYIKEIPNMREGVIYKISFDGQPQEQAVHVLTSPKMRACLASSFSNGSSSSSLNGFNQGLLFLEENYITNQPFAIVLNKGVVIRVTIDY